MRNHRKGGWAGFALLVALALATSACTDGSRGAFSNVHVYAVASHNGNVYEIDDTRLIASSTPLVSTVQNSTGELAFHNGIGYLAVSNWSNTAPGLYRFDPAKPAAGATRIGTAISAAYIAFASDSLAYVTSADYGTMPNALYSFNPSSPSSGLTKVADLSYPQDVAIGADGRVYVAENGSGKVARLDSAGTAVEIEIPCAAAGATGLLPGSYKGSPGVFVGNTGDYSTGSVEFIANSGTTAVTVVSGPVVARLGLLGASTLVVSGGFPAKTYGVDLTATTPAAVEVKNGTSSFGGGDIRVYNGSAYVPDGTNTLYAFSSVSGPVTAISVGSTGDLITNVGVDE